MDEKPLLELKNLTKVFGIGGGLGIVGGTFIKAVDGVSFALSGEKSNITALAGESGSGKTTIARMMLGFINPTSGEVLYKGEEVSTILKQDPKTYRREVQGIFQDPYSVFNPFYRVERVLKLAVRKFKLASNKNDEHNLIDEALEAIGLIPSDIIGRYPHQLSGGERQRVMLARILLLKPNLVIADEPVSMIDVSLRAIFLDELKKFKNKYGISCLYITHDLNIAHYIADNMVVLCLGNVVEKGDTETVVKDPLHPYTKLLITSIPIPNPHKKWKNKLEYEAANLAEIKKGGQGCVFYPRCPYAIDICAKEKPPIKKHKANHDVACFLY